MSFPQLIVQTGKPRDGEGFMDPATKALELFYKADAQPVYGITADDDRRSAETMAAPFQAYGAIGALLCSASLCACC